MRPPEFTGGNSLHPLLTGIAIILASMRPPEFTGGNGSPVNSANHRVAAGFNEAAGIHRRKPRSSGASSAASCSFNEAAGIHRRKPVGA